MPVAALDSRSPIPIRKFAVWTFVGLLCFNALLAIGLILGVSDGPLDTPLRLCFTTMVLIVASLAVAANGGAIEQRRLGPWPFLAIGISLAGCALLITMIWFDHLVNSSTYVKWLASSLVLGVGASAGTLISMARLNTSWRLTQGVAQLSAGALTLLGVTAIVTEDSQSGDLWLVLWVLLATSTILVAIGAAVTRRAHSLGRPVT